LSSNLLVAIRLHDGRYHGMGEWRPSPARLFQALVAAASRGGAIEPESSPLLVWLEALDPPVVGVPNMWPGQHVESFVPDNDLDSVGGDVHRVSEIRSSKVIAPRFFDSKTPFLYGWSFEDTDGNNAQAICTLAERLYQFGRGVDMAWAWGEILDDAEFETRLARYPGQVHRPSPGGRGRTLACPQRGSLQSLKERYAAYARRFRVEGEGKDAKRTFTQPPKPRFAQVSYDSPCDRRIYELRKSAADADFAVWPLTEASGLVGQVRDGATHRLQVALPERSAEIERAMIGRKVDGGGDGPTSARIRIVPLALIGHHYADSAIRRIMVDVPANCPLRADDVHWAFSGLEPADPQTGEVSVLVRSNDEGMLSHYTPAAPGQRVWQTVTPAALPVSASRRRIEPTRKLAEAKAGAERADEQARVAGAVIQALRHAEVRATVDSVRVQREPFTTHGARAEKFAPETRFAKERLWHVEIVFRNPITGPLILGDGRFLGLGVMAPAHQVHGVFAFQVDGGLAVDSEPIEIAHALRRALMARVQAVLGSRKPLPTFFTGHQLDGSPAKTGAVPHLSCIFDPNARRLLVIAPHVLDRREATREERSHLGKLDEALQTLSELRAGAAGKLALSPCNVDLDKDPLFAPSRTWESLTPCLATHHSKKVGAEEALAIDLRTECRRRGLPEPIVSTHDLCGIPGAGLQGCARLTFAVAISGPIILGKTRHLGGGLFIAVPLDGK
jgi:CRISPR-associated protein Csb2